jgi:hypothetical protein
MENYHLGLLWSLKHRSHIKKVRGICIFNEDHSNLLKKEISYDKRYVAIQLDTDVFNNEYMDDETMKTLSTKYKDALDNLNDVSKMNNYRLDVYPYQKYMLKRCLKTFKDKNIIIICSDPSTFARLGIKNSKVLPWIGAGEFAVDTDKYFSDEVKELFNTTKFCRKKENVKKYSDEATLKSQTLAFLK